MKLFLPVLVLVVCHIFLLAGAFPIGSKSLDTKSLRVSQSASPDLCNTSILYQQLLCLQTAKVAPGARINRVKRGFVLHESSNTAKNLVASNFTFDALDWRARRANDIGWARLE